MRRVVLFHAIGFAVFSSFYFCFSEGWLDLAFLVSYPTGLYAYGYWPNLPRYVPRAIRILYLFFRLGFMSMCQWMVLLGIIRSLRPDKKAANTNTLSYEDEAEIGDSG